MFVAGIVDHSELGGLDAVTTAERIHAGGLSAREAVEAAIDRAEDLEPALNAISTEMFESALSKADAPPRGPFRGVPTFIKGLEDEEDVINDHGSRAYAEHVAKKTEPFVREFQATGLVSLGRSATPEFGLNVTTEPLAHGPTRNLGTRSTRPAALQVGLLRWSLLGWCPSPMGATQLGRSAYPPVIAAW